MHLAHLLTLLQPRTALKPGTLRTGPERDLSLTFRASAAHLDAALALPVTAALMQDPTLVVSVVNVVAHLPLRAMESRVTSATGSEEDLSRLLLPPPRVKEADETSKEDPDLSAGSLQPGARDKEARVPVGRAVSFNPVTGRNTIGNPPHQNSITSGGPRCAPTRRPSHPHPHPTLASHHLQHLNLLHLLVVPD